MKELSIEEKAKAYDEALKKAKDMLSYKEVRQEDIGYLFPELKENEDEQKPILDVEIPFGAKDSELQEASYHIPEGFHAEIEGNKVVIKRGEQKPADIPEDFEKLVEHLLSLSDCEGHGSPAKVKEVSAELLRLANQQKTAWSKEDERMLDIILNDTNHAQKNFSSSKLTPYVRKVDWLKSRRPQNNITDEELAQAKKNAYNDALDKIEYHSGEPTFDDGWSAAIWYLKKRNITPRNTWKPSDEQITWLYRATDEAKNDSRMKQVLNELLSDLKKLTD